MARQFSKLTRRTFLKAGSAAAAGLGVSTLAMPTIAANEPIKLGVVQPFSGGLELFGGQAKLGLDLAVAEINAGGGIMGSPIELIYEDDKTDPKTSVERTLKLIQRDKVIAISGPITSANRDAMAPSIERFKTPLLYATNYEGGACGRYMFSFNTVPNQDLAKLLPFLKDNAGNSFYMFGADYIWPQKMFEVAEGIIAGQGGEAKGKEFTPFGTKEFAPVIRRIADSGAKVLVFALPGADGITFIKQAEDFGLMKNVTVAFLGFTETYLGAFGEGKGQGMYCTVPMVMNSEEPGVKDFVARVRKNAGDDKVTVSSYVMTHYNSVQALKAGLEKVGKIDQESAVDGMAGITFQAPTGEASVSAIDHHTTMNMYLCKTEGLAMNTVQALGAIAPTPQCG